MKRILAALVLAISVLAMASVALAENRPVFSSQGIGAVKAMTGRR